MFSPLGRKILKIEQKKISLKKDVMQKSILEFIQRGKQNSFNYQKAKVFLDKKHMNHVYIKQRLKRPNEAGINLKQNQNSIRHHRKFSTIERQSSKPEEESKVVIVKSKPLQVVPKHHPKQNSCSLTRDLGKKSHGSLKRNIHETKIKAKNRINQQKIAKISPKNPQIENHGNAKAKHGLVNEKKNIKFNA